MPEIPSHKVCTACKQNKPLESYFFHPFGKYKKHSKCKPCFREVVKRWQHSAKGKVKMKALWKRWSQSDSAKAGNIRRAKKHKEENPQRIKARLKVAYAMRKGRLIRPNECPKCGRLNEESRIEAHHHKGYEPEHWLDIEWMCSVCHKKVKQSFGESSLSQKS